MIACWNCRTEHEDLAGYCEVCGQLLKPDTRLARTLAERVDYLMAEVERWTFPLPDRAALLDDYRERKVRVLQPPAVRAPVAPPVPVAVEAPAPVETSETAEEHAEAPEPLTPVSPLPSPDSLTGFLHEQNIRWFHYLGAMLLFTSGVGYLRSQWNGAGKQLVALLLVLSPAFFFWAAARIHERLPVSSRLFSILGGLLLPSGLLAANQFHLLGLNLPLRPWSSLSFAVTAFVVLRMAGRLHEVACLYLGGLSLFLCLVTGAPTSVIAGLLTLGAAALFLVFGRIADDDFRPHYYGLSQGLAGLGLACALPSLARGPSVSPLVVLLFGSVFFASSAYLNGGAGALKLSAAVTCAAGFLAVRWLGLGPAALVVLGLTSGALYLSAARRLPADEEELIDLSFRLGSSLTAFMVGSGLVWQLLSGAAPRPELLSSCFVALLASGYYAAVAWFYRRPGWVYASAATAAYAWYQATALLDGPRPLAMGLLALACVVAAWRAKRRDYATPAVNVALGVALGSGLLQAHSSPFVWGCMAATYALAAAWLRQPQALYLTGFGLTLGYAAALPPGTRPGLALLPYVVALGLLALRLPFAYALPLARTALVLACGGALFSQGGSTLFGYALAFAVAGWLYRDWVWLTRPAREGLWMQAALCVPGSVAAHGAPALLAVSAALLLASQKKTLARPGLEFSALVWTAALPFGPDPIARLGTPLLWAAAVWLAAELQGRRLTPVLVGLVVVSLPGGALAKALSALFVARAGFKLDWRPAAWVGVLLAALAYDGRHPWMWWLFQAGLAAVAALAWRTGRRALAQELARTIVVIGGLVLATGDGPSALLYAALALAGAVVRQHRSALAVGCCLAAWAFTTMDLGTGLGMKWALLALLLLGLQQVVWPEGALFLSRFGLGLGLAAGVAGLVDRPTLLVTGLLFALRSRRGGAPDAWLAFFWTYLAYVEWLGFPSAIEQLSWPLAFWLLGWAELWYVRGSKQSADAVAVLGILVGLGPSLLASMVAGLIHALAVMALGLALVFVGVGRQRPLFRTAGGLGVLAEIGVQALHVAVQLPWQLVAAIVGLLLVGLGAFFERRRRQQANAEAARSA